jgi:hypothetical protein
MGGFDLNRVHLRYALQNGQPVSVRLFGHLRGTKKRPTDLYCPQCESRVTVRLQSDQSSAERRKIIDHFAHYPDSDCSLREGGETALHLNAKIYLAQRLSEYHHATLSYKCQRCQNEYPYLKIDDYDEVKPEMKAGNRRPDVLCLQARQPIGAAEIFYTHAVDQEKQSDLNKLGIAWFEIPALSVHPQYFRFIEAGKVISIDARGAGITYPQPPSNCEACAEELRKAAYRRHLEQLMREEDERIKREQDLQRREQLKREQERRRQVDEEERRRRYQEWKRKQEEDERITAEKRAKEQAERAEAERIAKEETARKEAERIAFEQSGGPAYLDENGDLRIPFYSIYTY